MNINELISECEAEEQKYQFSSFSRENARSLGEALSKEALNHPLPVAVEIRINHFLVYCYYPEGTNENNRLWLQAKANTVDMLGISSLHFWANMQKIGMKPEEQRMPRETYACCGGGFPLLLRGTGAIGTICVSGLADTEDHQVIINTLDKYFDKIS